MRKAILLLFCACLVIIGNSYGQAEQPKTQKNSQADMQNDIYAGYGLGSVYYFHDITHSGYPPYTYDYNGQDMNWNIPDPTSPGTFYFGYGRSLNQVITVGILFGYQPLNYNGKGTGYDYNSGTYTTYDVIGTDNLWTGMARMHFSYLNKPVIRIYSGFALGFTVDFANRTFDGNTYTQRKLLFAGQLTFMGLRFGRALGGFFEFGFGTLGIINAGISYKIKD
jgi:hypothetical protein